MATSSASSTLSIPNPKLIASLEELNSFLDIITPTSELYIDFEGNNLSRNGTISLITILIYPQKIVKVIDIDILGQPAFEHQTPSEKTLRSIFEDPKVSKYFWDVRNDAEALFSLHQVGLAGVTDIQLLENASRTGDQTYVLALDTCVRYDLKLGFLERERWILRKNEIRALMPYGVFSTRPVSEKTIEYCVADVIYLPKLRSLYLQRLQLTENDWLSKVAQESDKRIMKAHSPTYDTKPVSRKLGPWRTIQPVITDFDFDFTEPFYVDDDDEDFGFYDFMDPEYGEGEDDVYRYFDFMDPFYVDEEEDDFRYYDGDDQSACNAADA